MANFYPKGYTTARQELTARIAAALSARPKCEFYIGIATDVAERYPAEADRSDLSVLFCASPGVVKRMEADLIAHFKQPPFADRCTNKGTGGEGTDTATLLYIKLHGVSKPNPDADFDVRYFDTPINL